MFISTQTFHQLQKTRNFPTTIRALEDFQFAIKVAQKYSIWAEIIMYVSFYITNILMQVWQRNTRSFRDTI